MFLINIVVALLMVVSGHSLRSNTIVTSTLSAGFVDVGSDLCVVSKGSSLPMEASERLILKRAGKEALVNGLNDLKGSVKITDEKSALQYVRLRSSPATWYLWPNQRFVEIVDKQQATTLSTFGLRTFAGRSTSPGFLGIVSHKAFTVGAFRLASVERSGHDFLVRRWVLAEGDRQYVVRLIQERIGTDGAYACRILEQKPAPVILNTRWQIPMFE